MKYIKIFACVMLSLIANSAAALEAPKVSVDGSFNTQFGAFNSKWPFNYSDPSNPVPGTRLRDDFIFANETRLNLKADYELDGFNAGLTVQMHGDVSNSKTNNANVSKNLFARLESEKYGKVQLGSSNTASDQLKVSPINLAQATGGIDGDILFWVNPKTIDNLYFESVFLSGAYMPVGFEYTGRANKIVYFTPVYKALSGSIAYVPNTEIVGTAKKVADNNVFSVEGDGYKDVVDASLRYERKVSDVDFEASYSFQLGKAKNNGSIHRHALRAHEIGASAKLNKLTFAAAYGDWGKSGVNKNPQPGNKYGASFWAVGSSYDFTDALAASITYMESRRAGGNSGALHEPGYNDLKLASVGMTYKILEGVQAYAESSYFSMDRQGVDISNRDMLTIGGIKIIF